MRNIEEKKIDIENMNDDELYNFKVALEYASAQIRRLRDLNRNETSIEVSSFSDTEKKKLLEYLKSPKRNEKNIRNICITHLLTTKG